MRACSFLIVLVLAAAVAEAQAPASFREGVLAFEKKEWSRAEKLMREAVAGNPNETEGTVSIAGAWYETYVPHYFLARALAKQGKCAEALKEFAESERQGVTPKIPDFARHLETRGGCRPQGKKEKPGKVLDEVTIPMDDVPATTQPTTQTTQPQKIQPRRDVIPSATVQKRDLEETRRIETRARLTTAVSAYLNGQYELTAQLLTGAPFSDRAAAAEAALFRAAARHALYRIGGATDDALRQQVETDLRTYRELRPSGRPDPRVFPRGFIALAEKR